MNRTQRDINGWGKKKQAPALSKKTMKITPIDVIKGMSGKVCSHSDTYITLNSTSGKMFTGKICHPFTGEATQSQLTQQQAFKTALTHVNTWLIANKPSTTNGANGTSAYQEAESLKKQMGLSNIRQVIYKYMNAQGVVTLPSGSTSGGGSNTGGGGTNTGGGTSTGGGTNTGGDSYGD